MSEDEACPGCGARWDHEDPKLDFPNRQKVDDFWRCYNPKCEVGYYSPETGRIELVEVSQVRLKGRSTVASLKDDITAAYLLAKMDEEEKQAECKHVWAETTYEGTEVLGYGIKCSVCGFFDYERVEGLKRE